ncbi:hypothetical protein, partial [Peribacillus simplex]|uniref:hypothetical protein n=1 Tax=Peribacillus simplex TaxID=1478 RepID=UPI001C87FEF9
LKYWLAETRQALALMRLGRQSAERERISEISWNVFLKNYRLLFGFLCSLKETEVSLQSL